MSDADPALADSPTPSLERLRSIVEAGQEFLAAVDFLPNATRTTRNPRVLENQYRRAFESAEHLNRALGGRYGDAEVREPRGLPVLAEDALLELATAFERLVGNGHGGWGLRAWNNVKGGPPVVSHEMRFPEFGSFAFDPFSMEDQSKEEIEALRWHIATLSNYLEIRSARAEPTPTRDGTAPAASGSKSEPAADKARSGVAVLLSNQSEAPIVRGKVKPRLSVPRFNVVQALIAAGDKGLTGDELVNKSGHGGAVNTLKTLAKSDADWGAIILLPGGPGKRYRLRLTDIDGG